jgi:hypothetical protein
MIIGMVVNKPALLILMGAASLIGVVISVRITMRGTGPGWREEPWTTLGRVAHAVMLGVGAGEAAALVILLAAGLVVRLEHTI